MCLLGSKQRYGYRLRAIVNTGNKIRLETPVAVIEGQVAFTTVRTRPRRKTSSQWMEKKCWERFAALSFRAGTSLATILKSRHYGPSARLSIGLRPCRRDRDRLRDDDQQLKKTWREAQMAVLESKVQELEAKHAYFETVAARLEALELRQKHSIQITAEKSLGDKTVEVMP
jgi:hypothetical protein